MDTYSYEATTKGGSTVTGTIDAETERLAVDRLQDMGYFPFKVSRFEEKKKSLLDSLRLISPGVREKDIMTFTYQLGVLLDAGFPIDKALSILSDMTEKKSLKTLINEILSDVREGLSLSESLSKFPLVFPLFYVNMVRAGETGGFLEDTISRMAVFLEKAQALKDDVRSALIYPLILSFFGGIAVIILLTFVVPKFTAIFADMGAALPLATRILLAISGALVNYWWLLLIITIGCVISFQRYMNSKTGKKQWDNLKFRLPVMGKLYRETVTSRFARILGTLLANGITILNALQIVKGTLGSEKMADIITSVREAVKKGRTISEPLKNNDIFPPLAVHMVTVGEETGRLDEMLLKIADRFDMEVRTTVKRLLALLEPTLILLMGSVIGFIVIAMLIAIFSINELPGI